MKLREATELIASKAPLSDDQAEAVVGVLYQILKARDDEYDDALDALGELGPAHSNMVPVLLEWIDQESFGLRIWAIHAVRKVGYKGRIKRRWSDWLWI